tara:strand:+ start:778 stop:1557 length:780 start_codon:yes stop_codon:yes gene_type:complete
VHCYVKENFLDRDVLKSIKTTVDWFIEERINLYPIRKVIDGRLVSLEYEEHNQPIEYLTDLSNLEQDTPSVRIENPLLNIPELVDVVFNKDLYNEIKTNFQLIPTIEYVKIVRHFPNKYLNMVNEWHYDNFGEKGIRVAVIYLDDIQNIEDGPYVCVENSDKNKISNERSIFSDNEVEDYYNKEAFKPVFGNMGDVIFSKGNILHKSIKPSAKERTVLIINFETNISPDRTKDKIKLNWQDWYKIPVGKKELAYNMEII